MLKLSWYNNGERVGKGGKGGKDMIVYETITNRY